MKISVDVVLTTLDRQTWECDIPKNWDDLSDNEQVRYLESNGSLLDQDTVYEEINNYQNIEIEDGE
jgi:hypothetical protein